MGGECFFGKGTFTSECKGKGFQKAVFKFKTGTHGPLPGCFFIRDSTVMLIRPRFILAWLRHWPSMAHVHEDNPAPVSTIQGMQSLCEIRDRDDSHRN